MKLTLFLIKQFCILDCQLLSLNIQSNKKKKKGPHSISSRLLYSCIFTLCLLLTIFCFQYEHWEERFSYWGWKKLFKCRYPLKVSHVTKSLPVPWHLNLLGLFDCPFPKSWRNSKLPARKTPQARQHGALALLLSSVRGADFFVRVAAAVRVHAVVSDHFSYKRTQTQSGNNCTPVHKCSCSLTQIDTPSVAGDKYTCLMTCIYTHRHSWLLHTFV